MIHCISLSQTSSFWWSFSTHHIIQAITTIVEIVEFALDKVRFPIFRWSNDFRWFNAQQFVCHFDGVRNQLAFKSTWRFSEKNNRKYAKNPNFNLFVCTCVLWQRDDSIKSLLTSNRKIKVIPFRFSKTGIPPNRCRRIVRDVWVCFRSAHFVSLRIYPPMRIQKREIKNQKKNENTNLSLHIGWRVLIFSIFQWGDENDDTNWTVRARAIRTHLMCREKVFFSLASLRFHHVVSCRHMDRKRREENIKICGEVKLANGWLQW